MNIFDSHVHLSNWNSEVIDALIALNVSHVCNISYPKNGSSAKDIESYEQLLFNTGQISSVKTLKFISLPFSLVGNSVDSFIDVAINKIQNSINSRSIVGVKIWKDVGMKITCTDGVPLKISDERLRPIYECINRHNLICIVHTADPVVAWSTDSASIQYYKENPEFRMFGRKSFPSHSELIGSFKELLEQWPNIRFVGAHFASLDHDLDYLSRVMDQHPNLFVDSAGRHSCQVRDNGKQFISLLEAHPKRVLYGSDWTIGTGASVESINSSLERRKQKVSELKYLIGNDMLAANYFNKNSIDLFLG